MKRTKKLLAFLLAFALIFGSLPSGMVTVSAEGEATGAEAENVEAEAEKTEESEEEITADSVQALINALPDADDITADNAEEVEAALDAIDVARVQLGAEADDLDYAKYDAACVALAALEGEEIGEPVTTDDAVAQIGNDTYTSLAEAISAAASGDTVTLLSDITLSSCVAIGNSITLDLNNCTITGPDDDYVFSITSDVSVTIKNGNITGYKGIYVKSESASLTVDSASITAEQLGMWLDNGTLNVTGSTVTGETLGINQRGGALNISSSTIGGASCPRAIQVVAYYSDTTTNITDSTISATNLGIYVADSNYAATLTIGESGGNASALSVTGTYYGAIYATNGADVIVNSGTLSSGSSGILVWGGESDTNPTTLTVNGGTITGTVFGVVTNGATNYTEITINDGNISGEYGMYLPAMDSTTTVNGGTITGTTTGIEIRAGELIVNGGTICSTANTFEVSANGTGTTVVGAGIAVSQHTTDQEITVTITGGDISGYCGVCETNTRSTNTSAVTVTISGENTNISTTDTTSGAAVYSTSMDDSYTGTKANNTTAVTITAGNYNTDVGEYLKNSNGNESGSTYVLLANSDGTYTAMTETEAKEQAAVYVIYTYTNKNGQEQTYIIYYDSVSAVSSAIDATVTGENCVYDGMTHTISVIVTSPASATVTYSTDGQTYSSNPSTFTNAGTYTVYYKIEDSSIDTVYGSAIVNIEKATQSISYETASVSKTVGDEDFTNKLTETLVYGDITYTSSDTSVATVDATGKVTIVGAGTATIKASASESDNYYSDTTEYTLVVEAASTTSSEGSDSSNTSSTTDENSGETESSSEDSSDTSEESVEAVAAVEPSAVSGAQTGDTANLNLFLVLGAVCEAALIVMIALEERKRRKRI